MEADQHRHLQSKGNLKPRRQRATHRVRIPGTGLGWSSGLKGNYRRRTDSNPFRKNTALCKAQRLWPSIARSRSLSLIPLDLVNCTKLLLNRSSGKQGSLLSGIGCCEGGCVICGDCCCAAPLICASMPLVGRPLAGTWDGIRVKFDCGVAEDMKFCC